MKFKTPASVAVLLASAWLMGGANKAELLPRVPVPKTPTERLVVPKDSTGRLIVKFADSALVRPAGANAVGSLANHDLTQVNEIVQDNGMRVIPASRKTDEEFAVLQQRAAQHSGKAQPDLGGIIYFTGPKDAMLTVARALNDLDVVEWVEFDVVKRPFGVEPACGVATTGDCFNVAGNGTPFCNNQICCQTICNINPFCCADDPFAANGFWDEVCAALAHLYCASPPADRCTSFLNGGCFEAHSTPGCVTEVCCNTVCAIDDFCCMTVWDESCVSLAWDNCTPPVGGPVTPDFRAQQGYLRPSTYAGQLGGVPMDLGFPAPLAPGYAGEGFDLQGPNYGLVPVPPAYAGLYGLSRQLFEQFGVGATNPPNSNDFNDLIANTRGRSIKVAVIEWAYWGAEPFTDLNNNGQWDAGEPFTDLNDDGVFTPGHEDLDVISEPGQTLLLIPTITDPDHGTACLGIINGQDNGFGVTGIAPEAQAYFFPLTSVEEGPRDLAAWTSALQTLGPGDVISASYGPGPPLGNINNSQFNWTLIRLGSDLGITTCIAAGNDCYNLDNAPDLGDSGGVVVGAGSAGRPHYRLIFSNFYQEVKNPAVNGNMVHIQAWGGAVTTTGTSGGALYHPDQNRYRSYTNNFGGTSAAAPQIAGLVACLQGLAKQFYGIPLQPAQIRAALADGGFPQQGIPNPQALPGFNPALGCSYDIDPDDGPNKIGPFPRTTGDFNSAASAILNTGALGFDGSPLINSVTVLRGNHVFGNIYSLKASDNNWFIVEAVSTTPGAQPNPTGPTSGTGVGGIVADDPAPGVPQPLPYRAFGNVTDILIGGRLLNPATQGLSFSTEAHISSANLGLMFVEAFNWQLNRWVFIDFRFVGPAGDEGSCGMSGGAFDPTGVDCIDDHPVTVPGSFIRPGDNQFYVRLWTVVPGQLTLTAHTIRHDFFGVGTVPVISKP